MVRHTSSLHASPSTRSTMVVLVNGRDKVICLNKMEATQVAVKVGFFP